MLAADVRRLSSSAARDDSEVIRLQKLRPVDPRDDRDQREQHERRPDRGRDEDPAAARPTSAAGGSRLSLRVRRSRRRRGPAARSSPSTSSTNSWARSAVLALRDGGDRVAVDRPRRLGELDALDVVAGGDHVGDVDQPGVGLAGGDLAEHVGDRLLLAHRASASRRRSRRPLGGRAAGHLRARRSTRLRPSSARSANVCDAGRVARRHGDLEGVGGESLGVLALQVLGGELVHVGLSAEANTSAGAPSWIWATRSEDPPKLSSTSTPSCSPRTPRRSARRSRSATPRRRR